MPNKPTSTGSEPVRMGGGLTGPNLRQDEQKKGTHDEKVTSKNKLPNPFLRPIKDPDRIEETD